VRADGLHAFSLPYEAIGARVLGSAPLAPVLGSWPVMRMAAPCDAGTNVGTAPDQAPHGFRSPDEMMAIGAFVQAKARSTERKPIQNASSASPGLNLIFRRLHLYCHDYFASYPHPPRRPPPRRPLNPEPGRPPRAALVRGHDTSSTVEFSKPGHGRARPFIPMPHSREPGSAPTRRIIP
jgi:hypothetical protein